MEIKREFVIRKIADETLLVPTGKAALDLNGMLTLNDVGARIWELLPEIQNEEDLIQRLYEEYETTPEVLRADVAEFLGQLRKMGIL